MIGLLNSPPSVNDKDIDWDNLGPMLGEALGRMLYMVCVAMLIGGVTGLTIGVLFYTTRDGGALRNKLIYQAPNVPINFARPVPFIISTIAIGPLTKNVVGTTIGTEAAAFAMSIAATFAIARLVEQNLMSIDSGMIKAARAMGASPWCIIRTVVMPEALGSLVLGYTFAFIAVVNMSAMAGYIDGGGLGNFVITRGYQVFGWNATLVTTLVITFIVQLAQILGNWFPKKTVCR